MPTGARAVRSGLEADPWGLPALLARDGAAGVDVSGALRVGGLELLGARAYDPATMAFLSTDPLTHADAAPWAANPYSYAGNNPVALSDPLGLRPLTDDELNAYNDAHTGWHAAWNWVKDNKDYLIGGALVIAGGIAAATGFGGPLGMMLIGAGADMIIQRATTGSVNYAEVVVSGLLGAAGGAGGSALAGRLGLKGVWAAAASGAGAGALPGGTMGGYSYMSSPGPHTPAGFLQATATGTLEGGVTGGLGGAAGHGLTTLGRTALGKLRPQPSAPAPAPFKPPRIWTDRHGFLTNGTYAVDSTAMRLHTDGNFGSKKSQWWSYVDAEKATLDAAAYADEYRLWHRPKAKVVSVNGTVGTCGETGEETNVINLYRGDPRGGVRMVHGLPGN